MLAQNVMCVMFGLGNLTLTLTRLQQRFLLLLLLLSPLRSSQWPSPINVLCTGERALSFDLEETPTLLPLLLSSSFLISIRHHLLRNGTLFQVRFGGTSQFQESCCIFFLNYYFLPSNAAAKSSRRLDLGNSDLAKSHEEIITSAQCCCYREIEIVGPQNRTVLSKFYGETTEQRARVRSRARTGIFCRISHDRFNQFGILCT